MLGVCPWGMWEQLPGDLPSARLVWLRQWAVTLTGPTAHQSRPPYAQHPDRLPLSLQDHGHPVRFRNIWLRELEK